MKRTATVKDIFDEIDTNKSGDIDADELRTNLSSKGYSADFIAVCYSILKNIRQIENSIFRVKYVLYNYLFGKV